MKCNEMRSQDFFGSRFLSKNHAKFASEVLTYYIEKVKLCKTTVLLRKRKKGLCCLGKTEECMLLFGGGQQAGQT